MGGVNQLVADQDPQLGERGQKGLDETMERAEKEPKKEKFQMERPPLERRIKGEKICSARTSQGV